MKKVLVLLALVAAASAYSQGTVNFNNRVTTATPPILAPVSYDAAGPMAAGPISSAAALSVTVGAYSYGGANAMAALYGGAPGAGEGAMTLLVPAVGFRSGTLAGYVNVGTAGIRTIDTIASGQPADVQIRVWDAGSSVASYEAAQALLTTKPAGLTGVYLGKSDIIHISQLGGGSPPITPPNLVGLTAFTATWNPVPEPSIIGLGLLGAAAALVVFRRRE